MLVTRIVTSDLNWLLKENRFETAIHAVGVKKKNL
jgi:hypothetical protein